MSARAIIGGTALAVLAYSLMKAFEPQRAVMLTYADLMGLQNNDGSVNFTQAFKPAINSTDSEFFGFGLHGAPQGLGSADFDFGSWAYETEPWGVQNIQADIVIPEENIELMNVDQLIVAVAEHLKGEEGFVGYIYDDVNGKPWTESKRGNPTIGYGHLVTADDIARYGWGWVMNEGEAYMLLLQDVNSHLAPVVPKVTVPLTLPQWVAITSLAFNAGPHRVKKSKFIAAVNAQNLPQAEVEFKDWNKATIKVDGQPVKRVVAGLVNRRNREWQLFMTPSQVVYLEDGGAIA